jgi:hypothetical protein
LRTAHLPTSWRRTGKRVSKAIRCALRPCHTVRRRAVATRIVACKGRTLSATKVVWCEPSAKRRMLREVPMNAAAVQIILVTLTFFTFVMARSGLR